MNEFTALVLDRPRKVLLPTSDGVYEYKLHQALPDGFYVFEASRYGGNAKLCRKATVEERDTLMRNAPRVNAVTSMYDEPMKLWYCHPLNLNQIKDKRLHFPAPLLLPTEELSILQPVQAWVMSGYGRKLLVFKDLHLRYPSERLDKIRMTLIDQPLPRMLNRVESTVDKQMDAVLAAAKNPTPEELAAYQFAVESTKPPVERLINESLRFVGAKLVSYQDLGSGQYKVNYEYKGTQDNVTVNQKMTVVDAGICLTDRQGRHYMGHVDFDLGSIVLVKQQSRKRFDDPEDDDDPEVD